MYNCIIGKNNEIEFILVNKFTKFLTGLLRPMNLVNWLFFTEKLIWTPLFGAFCNGIRLFRFVIIFGYFKNPCPLRDLKEVDGL